MAIYLVIEQAPVVVKCTLSTTNIKTVIEESFSNVVYAENTIETKGLKMIK
jgi:hypothetical protein